MFTRHLNLDFKPDAAIEFARVMAHKSVDSEMAANKKGSRQ
jgi:hypothetical protein